MSTAVRDLPDPTDPTPGLPPRGADDLLAKIADDAIDELMAARPPRRHDGTAEDAATNVDEAAHALPPGPTADEPAARIRADDASAAPGPPADGVSPEPPSADLVPPLDAPPPPAADRRALLPEPAANASPALWPLRLLNAPFAWMGDRLRRAVGVLALASIVPAACAVVYVLFFKRS